MSFVGGEGHTWLVKYSGRGVSIEYEPDGIELIRKLLTYWIPISGVKTAVIQQLIVLMICVAGINQK